MRLDFPLAGIFPTSRLMDEARAGLTLQGRDETKNLKVVFFSTAAGDIIRGGHTHCDVVSVVGRNLFPDDSAKEEEKSAYSAMTE